MLETVLEKCKNNHIYIYGDGSDGRLTRIFLYEQNIDVEGFVVTGSPRRKELMGLPVISLTEIPVEARNSLFFICMNKSWYEQASDNLEKIGCSNHLFVDNALRKSFLENVQFAHVFEDVEKGKHINTLLYHRVESLRTVSSLIVNARNFEEQLLFIKDNYDVLRADENWSGINRKSVVLTFDDGYVDFYKNAYPLLKKYNIPATVFVATGNIGTTNEFWWDRLERFIYEASLPECLSVKGRRYIVSHYPDKEELMDDIHDQIIVMHYEDRDNALDELGRQLNVKETVRERYRTMNSDEIVTLSKDPLITIGAHTVSHVLCDCEDADCQKREIEASKLSLEKITGKEINLFAYPNGNVGKDTRGILEELGFKRAFTCVNGCVSNDEMKYDIPRCPVLNWPAEQNAKWFRGMWQTGKDV